MIFIIFLLVTINFIPLCAMLPHTGQPEKSKEQTIKITCSDKEMDMPIDIVAESKLLSSMINDLGGADTITNKNGIISIQWQSMPNNPIPIELHSYSTIKNLCETLKDFSTKKILNIQNISKYQLKELITLTNAFHFFDFSGNKNLAAQWDKKIDNRIYQHCKDMSLDQLEQQVIPLYPSPLHRDLTQIIFCKPIINAIKFELMKRAFTDERKKKLPKSGGMGGISFSPNNKMLADVLMSYNGINSLITISFFENNTITSESKENVLTEIKQYWSDCGKFSYNNKSFICGSGTNILIYTIDNAGAISDQPIQTIPFTSQYDQPINQQISLSPDGKLMACCYGSDLLLWKFNDDGTINESSQTVLTIDTDTSIISPIQFDDEGTIRVVSKNKDLGKSTLYIFNADGTTNSQADIDGNLLQACFYEHDKKFVATNKTNNPDRKPYMSVYDFSNIINISKQDLSEGPFDHDSTPCIIFDDTAMIAKMENNGLAFIDINNDNSNPTQISRINIPVDDLHDFRMSPDNKKIVLMQYRTDSILYTLLTPEEENILESINKLDIKPLLHLDKVLRKTEDASTLRQYEFPQIIELLQKIDIHASTETQNEPQQIKEAINTPKITPEAGQWIPQQPTNPQNPETITAALQALQKPKTDEPKNPPAPPSQITQPEKAPTETQNKPQPESQPEPQPESQPENNEQQPTPWKRFFTDIYEKAYSLISTVRSFFSRAINYFIQ